jgi:hypothetical protein
MCFHSSKRFLKNITPIKYYRRVIILLSVEFANYFSFSELIVVEEASMCSVFLFVHVQIVEIVGHGQIFSPANKESGVL